MKLFRNPEFKKLFILCGVISVAACGVAFWYDWKAEAERVNTNFGWLMLAVCVTFFAIFCAFTYGRYKRMNQLAADIDKILHGGTAVPLEQYAEGELAVLQSEVYKMTIRLREQQQHLQDDKLYLADSLADISHQIRTPLTSINLLVNFLSEPDISDERRQKLSHELYGMLSRIDWLITALLKISKLDAGTVQFKVEQISFAKLIQKAVSPVLVSMELRGQALELETKGDFYGDIAWTREAITNIVKNCMEHTPEGGVIRICTDENALYSEIVIWDTGNGIATQDLPHIFERFYKGQDSDEKSFGIGLALARMIITVQNGTIKAENHVQGGAKFTIRFYKGTV